MADLDLGIEGLSNFREIGAGGFARVYSATEGKFGRTVAVKVLVAVDDTGRRRFEREQLSMGRLTSHPRVVVPYFSGFTPAGQPYLVMEYLGGGSLEDRVERNGPLSPEMAIEMLAPIAEALGHGHAQGILHRDVKPANILLGDNDLTKLADFGISAVREATVATVGISFTLAHAPPETFEGGIDGRDERSDLYSLASTLFAVIDGHPPFALDEPGDSQMAYMVRIAKQPVPPLRNGPPQLAAFLSRAMAKDPADRPPNAEGFVAELRATMGRPPPAHRVGQAPEPPSSDELVERGDRAYAEGRYPVAIEDYDRAIAADPANALAFYNRGRAHRRMGNRAQAIDDFGRAIKLDPDHAPARLSRAKALLRTGRQDLALDDASRGIDLDPRNAELRQLRAELYLNGGNRDLAIADLTAAIAATPSNPELYTKRGNAYRMVGKRIQAIHDYTAALTIDPTNANVLFNRATTYDEIGDRDQAARDYQQAIALNPDLRHDEQTTSITAVQAAHPAPTTAGWSTSSGPNATGWTPGGAPGAGHPTPPPPTPPPPPPRR